MNTKYDFKIATDQYEVIGQGRMITTPQQVGDWWVTPAEDYKGQVPPEIQKKMFEFLNSGTPFLGLLIAEDMREVEEKRNQTLPTVPPREQRPPTPTRDTRPDFGPVLSSLASIAAVLGVLFLTAIQYDPMLIAVLDDGRWICLGTWYD